MGGFVKLLTILGTLLVSVVALTAGDDAVVYVPHDKAAPFIMVKGGTMIPGSDFEVQGTHRDRPGGIEVHVKERDVFYVVDGEAIVVAGGTLVNPRETRPGQMTGTSIEGGETYHLTKGDVMTIPAGMPHWFKETTGVSYFVVKVKKP
jgi:mannose-6-phosphate isomerase-like protein (cupin superfamily)